MAQLRDAQTSQFIDEGTPLEMATLAAKIGFKEVLFDDVGHSFDPQAVLDAHAEAKTNLPSDASDEHKAQIAEADKLKRGALKSAQQSIKDARAAATKD